MLRKPEKGKKTEVYYYYYYSYTQVPVTTSQGQEDCMAQQEITEIDS